MIPLHVFTFFEMKPLRVIRVLELRKLIFRVICKMLFVVIIHTLTFSIPSVEVESFVFFQSDKISCQIVKCETALE